MKHLKKLPIGIQTFQRIRTQNYLYIDKTKEAYDLIESGTKFYFLSRPRRFGKSLFLDTLQDIFEAKKELFKDLYIYDKYNWEEKYPVIKLMFNFEFLMLNDLEEKIIDEIEENAKKFNITLKKSNCSIMFENLISEVHKKYNQKVVILIDDWDKPIRNYTHKQLKEIHQFLLGLYITTKDDEFIKFTFATGLHPLKGDMLFGFNHFFDISLMKKYGNICGFTKDEILDLFNIQNSTFKIIEDYYNGYYFLKDPVYNPFDTLLFIDNDFMYDNYWFASGTPTFLIKLIKQNNYFLPKLSNLIIDEKLLNSFDIDDIDLEVILYQAGYLTIDEVIEDEDEDIQYKLKLPNKEVKSSLNSFIVTNLYKDTSLNKKGLSKALRETNLEAFKTTLETIFASIPYNNYTKNSLPTYEGFYASVVYVYLQSLGLNIIGEDVTNKGRIDLTIILDDKIYILEFKVGSDDALQQIKDKNYHQKYLNINKDIYLLGINFDEKEKNISKFEWERI